MKKVIHLFFLLSTHYVYAQSSFEIEMSLGYAYQNKAISTEQNLYNSDALGLRVGANFQQALNDKIYFETGLLGKYNRGKKSTELVNFVSHNLRLQIPIYLGFRVLEKWAVSTGLGLENNRDLNDINFFKKHKNIRYDLLTKFTYSYTSQVYFSMYTNWSLSKSPDIYSVSSPENGLYFGIIYKLR